MYVKMEVGLHCNEASAWRCKRLMVDPWYRAAGRGSAFTKNVDSAGDVVRFRDLDSQ